MGTPVPASVRGVYADISNQLEIGKEYARARLQAELQDLNPVVVQARVKSVGSVYAKLQRGEVAKIVDLDDLIAMRAVFLHPQQVETALKIIEKAFPVVEKRNVGVGQPTDFRYQQPHLFAHFPSDWLERHQELVGVKIEFQFTTYIQHALQESTHDVIYKGSRFSWQEHRLDAQLRGLLEIVDNVLANLSNIASVGDEPEYGTFDSRNEIIDACETIWSQDALPDDRRRMAITLEDLLRAAKIEISEFLEMSSRHSDLVNALSLGPVDKVLGILLRELGEDFVQASKKRRFVISSELKGLVPETEAIPQDRRVDLTF